MNYIWSCFIISLIFSLLLKLLRIQFPSIRNVVILEWDDFFGNLVYLQTELTSEDKRKAHQQELREQLHEEAKRRLLEAQGKTPEKKYVCIVICYINKCFICVWVVITSHAQRTTSIREASFKKTITVGCGSILIACGIESSFFSLFFNPLLPLRQSYANKSGKSWVYMNPKSGLEIWLKESRFRFETHSKFM